jgi:hypothetical protein
MAKVHRSRTALIPVNNPRARIRKTVPGMLTRAPTTKKVDVRERRDVGEDERTGAC